ncbi:hypothetical protein GJV85_11800 [Sulfurimonas aquatica]|uniref:Glycosyltransferase RgtA/B/C/D-like domain-containing protein n=1 Tax=Sulfurimonas aquatica TaxID=2672570 RepID=A0A975B277_9BACT|nr:hypothetical protein [Sulfurimonas aquatica]QSZ42768.1 hypothetical protein GJV85_11800 [Sulfurimonas aquatica]
MNKLRELLLKYPQTTLVLIISIVYLYFQLDMLLRTTGDEKTYVAQALEMQRDGHWFMQTLFDEPDYYKGPLHLIFLKIGFFLFGTNSMFATVYMNFFGLIAATLLLYKMFVKELDDKSWGLFYASSFSVSIGLYSHMFASQMEAELVIFYAIVMYLLHRLDYDNRLFINILLWAFIGMTGWFKSPAYSVFLGFSVLVYWVITLQIKERVLDKNTWISLFIGILIGFAAYIPILIYDGEVFIEKYIIKESMSKGANGVPWTEAFFPIFTYFVAPWMFAAVFSYLIALKTIFSMEARILNAKEMKLIKLAFSILLPTLAFFTIHPYRGDIYALPAVSATLLIAYLYWRAYVKQYEDVYVWMMRLSAIVLSIVPLVIVALYLHLSPMPEWWPEILFPLALFSFVFTLGFIFYESKNVARRGPVLLVVAFIPLFLTLGFTMRMIGKAEMLPAKEYIKKNNITKALGDYNLHKSYWNEYGSLNTWLGHDVVGLHTQEKLFTFLREGNSLIIPGENRYSEFKEKLPDDMKLEDFDVFIWKRWLTHGKGPNGESMFLKYWKSKDITDIQRNFYILKLKEPKE